jgi:nucleotide-binding universal stress UspA family protein
MKVLIAMDLSPEEEKIFEKLYRLDFLKSADIKLVHIFNTVNYSFMFGEFPLVYPVEADKRVLEAGVMNLLKEKIKYLENKGFQGQCQSQCLFDDNPKARFCDLVKQETPDLVILGARLKHGLFEGSFSSYVHRHSAVDLLILKPSL